MSAPCMKSSGWYTKLHLSMYEAERLEQRLGVQRLLDAEAKWGDAMLALNCSTPMKLDAASYLIRLVSSDFHDHSLLVLHPGQHE
jgi:hypothetical protein